MATYQFVTEWTIEAPIEAVWEVLLDTQGWPSWWTYVESVVELEPGDETGLGTRRHLTWKTRLPYKISFEAAVSGEVDGSGRWTLSGDGATTKVQYDWNVRTTKRWMEWLAPLARPVFAWNHNSVMERGGEALARKLGARFLGMRRPPGSTRCLTFGQR